MRQFPETPPHTPQWVYQRAVRNIARAYGLTWARAVERFDSRLVRIQCNVVTEESVLEILSKAPQKVRWVS